MLKTRIITAVVLLAGFLGALFFLPSLPWAVLCALICALAAWEWGGLAGWGKKARTVYGIVLGGLCLVPVFLRLFPYSLQELLERGFFSLVLLAGFFWLFVVPCWLYRKWPLHRLGAALVGVVVLVPPTLFFIAFREIYGSLWLLTACALVWIADIAAYFSGRAFGGKKLAPSISPGKTWAGAMGAIIGVLVYCNVVLFAMKVSGSAGFEMRAVLLYQLVFICLAVWSIIGDLFESLLKRQAGVKDSSQLLPGHGGILDRIDSLTATLALLYFMMAITRMFSSYH